jgi:hypothetical protein
MKRMFILLFVGSIFLSQEILAQAGNRQILQQQLLTMSISQQLHAVGDTPLWSSEIDGTQKKSVFLAVVFSLLIPGAGEYYADGYSRGKYFTIAEAGLWMTYAGFQIYGTHVKDDARRYAAVYAGIQSEGKDDDFFVDIGNYNNVYQYNEKKLQDRRLDLIYDPSTGYAWDWQSTSNRLRYRDLRISSDDILYNSRFVIAAVIANHVVSAISAGKAAADHNKALTGTVGQWRWRIYPQVVATSGIPDGFAVGIETRF